MKKGSSLSSYKRSPSQPGHRPSASTFQHNTNHWIITAIVGKIEIDPDAEAEAVATICMISTPPELRVAESKWFLSVDFSFYIL